MNYGLLLGLVSLVFSIMLYTQKMHYEMSGAVIGVSVLLGAVVIFLAVNAFKKANGGFLSLSESLKVAVGVALIGAVITLLYQYVLTHFIEPDFLDKAIAIAKPKAFAENPNLTEEQWAQGIEMQKSFAWVQYPIGLIMNCIFGLIIGLVVGLILKKSKPAY